MNQSLAASDQTGLTSEARTVETISEQIRKKTFFESAKKVLNDTFGLT